MYYRNGLAAEPVLKPRQIASILNFPFVTVWRIIRQFNQTRNLTESVRDKRVG